MEDGTTCICWLAIPQNYGFLLASSRLIFDYRAAYRSSSVGFVGCHLLWLDSSE